MINRLKVESHVTWLKLSEANPWISRSTLCCPKVLYLCRHLWEKTFCFLFLVLGFVHDLIPGELNRYPWYQWYHVPVFSRFFRVLKKLSPNQFSRGCLYNVTLPNVNAQKLSVSQDFCHKTTNPKLWNTSKKTSTNQETTGHQFRMTANQSNPPSTWGWVYQWNSSVIHPTYDQISNLNTPKRTMASANLGEISAVGFPWETNL